MATRQDTVEFFEKAREYGLIDEMDRELEIRKNERRVAVIGKIKALPGIEKSEVPAITKAATAAHKTLQLAEEAYRVADRQYKELSMRAYGAQLQFDGQYLKLEREALELAPDFLREALEDLRMLEGLVAAQLRFDIEATSGGWFGRETITTSNSETIRAYNEEVKAARARITAMMLEVTERETAVAEVATIITKAETDAYAIGVSTRAFAERRKPIDATQKAEDRAAKDAVKRVNAADQRRAQIASIQV
jgi:hypothetical protein